MTGIRGVVRIVRICWQAAKPVMSGRLMSRTTRSTDSEAASRTASVPLDASTTLKPAARSTRLVAYRAAGWSSTTRMRERPSVTIAMSREVDEDLNVERRAETDPALHEDAAAQQLGEPAAQREAESGAAEVRLMRRAELHEVLEQ